MKHKAIVINGSTTTVSTVGAGFKPAPTKNRMDLPEEWDVLHLENVVDILDSQRVPVNAKDRERRAGNVPYYGATGQVGWIDDYLFDEELVLLGEDGAPFLEPTKQKAYIIRGKSWVNNHAHVLRARNGIPNAYIKYYLDIVDYHKFVSGTTRLKLNQSAMRQISVPIALPDQQKLIVAEIEKQFSRLDEAVAALKRIKANLKRYKASVLKAAVEGKLTEQWRKEHPDVESASELLKRILVERRKKWEEDYINKYVGAHGHAPKDDSWKKKYKEPAQTDTSKLPKLPKGWVWTTIGQIAECLDSKRVPVNKKARAVRQGNIPYYGANGQVGWIDGYLFDETLVLVVEDETFTGRELPFSYKISGKSWVNNHAHVLRNSKAVNVDLLNYSLAHYPFTPLTTGTTGRKKLTQAALLSALYKLPPLSEQIEIVNQIENCLSVAEEIEAVIETNLKRTERLRQSILKKAFTGTLVQ
jgi:type I restriction enzyme, S subunit